jgi:hypothetical protein
MARLPSVAVVGITPVGFASHAATVSTLYFYATEVASSKSMGALDTSCVASAFLTVKTVFTTE